MIAPRNNEALAAKEHIGRSVEDLSGFAVSGVKEREDVGCDRCDGPALKAQLGLTLAVAEIRQSQHVTTRAPEAVPKSSFVLWMREPSANHLKLPPFLDDLVFYH